MNILTAAVCGRRVRMAGLRAWEKAPWKTGVSDARFQASLEQTGIGRDANMSRQGLGCRLTDCLRAGSKPLSGYS